MQVEMEGHCQKGHESLEDERGTATDRTNGKVSARPTTPRRVVIREKCKGCQLLIFWCEYLCHSKLQIYIALLLF